MEVYLRVRRAVMVEGVSIREASRAFGLHRDTVRKMLAYSAPPGYRRQTPPRRPKLEPFTGVIDRILEDDLRVSRRQRHTAKRKQLVLRMLTSSSRPFNRKSSRLPSFRNRTLSQWRLLLRV